MNKSTITEALGIGTDAMPGEALLVRTVRVYDDGAKAGLVLYWRMMGGRRVYYISEWICNALNKICVTPRKSYSDDDSYDDVKAAYEAMVGSYE